LFASREYQNTVSSALRDQILSALRELLLGFQRADRLAEEKILRAYRHGHLQEVYSGLVTVMMRMVFILYAEEKNLLPMEAKLYADGYSLTRLYAQLREDRGRHGDTMDERYGAWARVITLFRLLHDGARAATGLVIAARKGDFFRPDAYPFLEGRERGSVRQGREILDLPKVSDGVVYRVLDLLLMLKGERLQYRGLDVEQIGSVYEGLMGFEIETAEGDSLCLMPEHVVVNLEALLGMAGGERGKELKRLANLDLKDKAGGELKSAKTVPELQAALGRRLSARQPGLIAKSEMFLQPGEERRKTGSHYTPRALTEPIVATTLRPVLERLGAEVKPEQILELKICDPAMGSGAFLVEACRQLADHLVAAWRRTRTMPELPPDEDPLLHARRLIAQRCLYGVDKNPLAADLARLSMWLVTFAREHPFTFVDHALRCGDSLVGLSREQISSLTLDVSKGTQIDTVRTVVAKQVARAEELRNQIHSIGDPPDNDRLDGLWQETNAALATVRTLGDLVIGAFFSADSDKVRKTAFEDLAAKVPDWLEKGEHASALNELVANLREGDKGVAPFHWEVEFPEVFARGNPGFDCFVGNPPFLGGTRTTTVLGGCYRDWLIATNDSANSNADLVAFFARRIFSLLRIDGTLGIVATNTIAQGDSREAGLYFIMTHGGSIYEATRRLRWPGAAAVVVSVIHILRGSARSAMLDGVVANSISSFLFQRGGDEKPNEMKRNVGHAFRGNDILGLGFLFDDASDKCESTFLMRELIRRDPKNADRIFPLLGGEDIVNCPVLKAARFAIDFGDMTFEEASRWPDLLAIVERRVKPGRQKVSQRDRRELWWLYATRSPGFRRHFQAKGRAFVMSRVAKHLTLLALDEYWVLNDRVMSFAYDSFAWFAVLQSVVHETWARAFGSTLEDRLNYTIADCFDTFPCPDDVEGIESLDLLGSAYHEFRADLMIRNNEGLTKTYNRFHNPEERSADILQLRVLHAQMDRAVLDAYGWTDILPTYDFREQLDESTRLTWAEDTRDEVLARLLELNRVMAAREADEAKAAAESAKAEGAKAGKKPPAKKRGRKDDATPQLSMLAPAVDPKEGGGSI
jgi:hypothetical protein